MAVFLGVCAALCVTPSSLGAASQLTGKALVQRLLRGPFDGQGVVVVGDVDLRRQAVDHAFSCRSCTFEGDFLATRAAFNGPVDLGRSEFDGAVDLSSARIGAGLALAAATFRSIADWRGVSVTGPLRATEARFLAPVLMSKDPATNQLVTLDGDVDFSLAVFGDIATFEGTTFGKTVDFTLGRFDSGAVLANGTSTGPATFARATFGGVADFSNFTFGGPVEFSGASFQGPAEFNEASFVGRASFEQARFAHGGTFLATTFPLPEQSPEDSFRDLRSDGDLNFDYSEIDRSIDFENIVVTQTFSFNQAQLQVANAPEQPAGSSGLHLAHVSAGAFQMDVPSATHSVLHTSVTDDLPGVLALIESSAKARGDLGTANDAHYERRLLDSHHETAPLRVLDVVFYRWAAGYFVRPLNPLVLLLALAAVATLARTIWTMPALEATSGDKGRLGTLKRATRTAPSFPREFLATLSLIAPAWGKSADQDRKGREIEILVYRILFACMLIGFANSNPTLRQMFDALR